MVDSFASFVSFQRDLNAMTTALTDPVQVSKMNERVARKAVKDAQSVAERDLGGDNKFSGWPRAPLVTKAEAGKGTSWTVGATNRSVGPWKVAEYGRHPGMSGHMQGPVAPKVLKSGKLSKRKQRFKKWNGSTDPKYTWTDAEDLIESETVGRLDDEVDRVIRRTMGG